MQRTQVTQHRASYVRSPRRAVTAAFRRMANGVDAKSAYASTVNFYRASGQEWTKQLNRIP